MRKENYRTKWSVYVMNGIPLKPNPIEIITEGTDFTRGKVLFQCDYCGTTFVADETQYIASIVDGTNEYFSIEHLIQCPLCNARVMSHSWHRYASLPPSISKELETVTLPNKKDKTNEKKISFWKKIFNLFSEVGSWIG